MRASKNFNNNKPDCVYDGNIIRGFRIRIFIFYSLMVLYYSIITGGKVKWMTAILLKWVLVLCHQWILLQRSDSTLIVKECAIFKSSGVFVCFWDDLLWSGVVLGCWISCKLNVPTGCRGMNLRTKHDWRFILMLTPPQSLPDLPVRGPLIDGILTDYQTSLNKTKLNMSRKSTTRNTQKQNKKCSLSMKQIGCFSTWTFTE